MRSVKQCFNDLEAFGITYLTGESDSLSFRGLCDITRKGKEIIREVFSLTETAFEDSWNSGGVASILLTSEMIPAIAVIALIRDGAHTVFSTNVPYRRDGEIVSFSTHIHGLYGDEALITGTGHWDDVTDSFVLDRPTMLKWGDEEPKDFRFYEWQIGTLGRTFRHGSGPHVGTRNVHAMSGRIS